MKKVFLFIMLLVSFASAVAQDNGFLVRVNQDVNLRMAPSIEADRWGTASAGQALHVIGESDSWYKILLDGEYAGKIVWLASWLDLTRLNAPPRYHADFDFSQIYQASLPSVVMLQTSSGGGLGFIIDRYGHIVTNAHVVDGGGRILVEFVDGAKTLGELIGVNAAQDIAVVKVCVTGDLLAPLPFSPSRSLSLGQPVLGIGRPPLQSWEHATGTIRERAVDITFTNGRTLAGLIQANMRAESGYSGGPLVDDRGKVMGLIVGGDKDVTSAIPAAYLSSA